MIYFIVNPNSQGGNGLKIWNKIHEVLEEKEVEYHVYFTEYPKHAIKISADITSDNTNKTIVILGGDGTVNEVINGIENPENITLGYIPAGSGNDYARGLNIPFNTYDALDVILDVNRKTIEIDQGRVQFFDGKSHRFASNGGIGFDAEIAKDACNSELKNFLNKIKLGKLIYVISLLKQIFIYKPVKAEIEIEGQVTNHSNLLFTAFNVNPFCGGGMKMCPDANPSDRLIDICIANNITKLRIFSLFPTIFSGNHIKLEGIKTMQSNKINIKLDRPVAVHTDGEIHGKHDFISLECTPFQVKMIVPNQPTENISKFE